MNNKIISCGIGLILFSVGIFTNYILNGSNFRERFYIAVQNIINFTPTLGGYESLYHYFFSFIPLLLIIIVVFVSSFFLVSFNMKFRKIKIFISYKSNHNFLHEGLQPNDYPQQVADEIRLNFNKSKNIIPLMIPFNTDMDHDSVIVLASKMIGSCDAVLVIPDPEDPSFVDAEIFASFIAKKPLAIIKIFDKQRLPNTALKGYPVIKLDVVRYKDYIPLRNYLLFLTNHYDDFIHRMSQISGTAFNFGNEKEIKTVLLPGLFIAFLLFITFWFFMPAGSKDYNEHWYYFYSTRISLIIFALVIFYTLLQVFVLNRIKISRIARQQIITGKSPYHSFLDMINSTEYKVESDQDILHILDDNLLAIRH